MRNAWKTGRISDLIASLESGVSVNGESRIPIDSEPAVLKVSAVTYGVFDQHASKPIYGSELSRAKCNPRAGELIVSRSNTPDLVGASAYVDRDHPNRYLPDKLWQTVQRAGTDLDMRWLAFFLASPWARFQLTRLATGTSSSMKNITMSELLTLPLLIPPYREQTAIAELLSIWDTAIEKVENLIAAKEKQFSALVHSLINNGAEHWAQLRVNEVFQTISEKKFSEEELLSVTQDRGVVPRSMFTGRVMSPQGGTDAYKLIKPGDFAVSLRSFQGGIEYSDYQGLISPAYTVLRPRSEINVNYFRHFFKTYLFINKYLNIAVIGIRDGKQISIPDLMTVKVPVPPIAEQVGIVLILNCAREEISLLNDLVEAYRNQKRGLMQKLLAGQWRAKPDVD